MSDAQQNELGEWRIRDTGFSDSDGRPFYEVWNTRHMDVRLGIIPGKDNAETLVGHRNADVEEALNKRADISVSEDTKRLDRLESLCFTNREGEREIHFDFRGTLREAIDGTMARDDVDRREQDLGERGGQP